MELTEEEIQDFIQAWKEDFGETLTPAKANEEITSLLKFLRMLDRVADGTYVPGELREEK